MELKIKLNEKNINSLLTELYAKGCNEVADAIETAYSKELNKTNNKQMLEAFLKKHNLSFLHRAYRGERKNGEVVCYYEFWKHTDHGIERYFTTKPMYLSNGKVYGRPYGIKYTQKIQEDAKAQGLIEI